MNIEKIENILSENVGEGYHIIYENEVLSPKIEWVDWVQQSDNENDILVQVVFEDDTEKTFNKGEKLRQIWHEYID